jgi:hypothetical protein
MLPNPAAANQHAIGSLLQTPQLEGIVAETRSQRNIPPACGITIA